MILWVFIEFFRVKIVIIDIYRYFIDILSTFTDILPIFFQKFQHKRACSTVAIFRWKNRFFPIFRQKIDDFTDFSSVFSSRCLPKTDFSTIYRSKKTIFCSLVTYKNTKFFIF